MAITAKYKIYHLLVLIAVIYILLFSIFPIAYMVYGSFTNWRLGVPEMSFVGLQHYVSLFEDYRFYNSLQVTFYITVIAVSCEVILGLFLAELMRGGSRFFRTIFLMPLFCAPVAVALMGEVIFYEGYPGGPVNGILNMIGIGNIPWRSSPLVAPFTVTLCDIWMWTPFCFLITLAALEAIPKELTEAAVVDGASSFQIFRKINLPLITGPLITISMFRIIDTLKIFDIPFVLVGGGGPGIATETLSIYAYKEAFRGFNMGAASAISVVFLMIVSIVSAIAIKRLRGYYA